MAKVPGATTSSSSGSGDRSSTRRSTSELTTRSPRPAPRSAGISASTTPADRIRALTGRRRIEPTSPGCRRSRRLEPGRGSTYRAGKTVRIDRASSLETIGMVLYKRVFFHLSNIYSPNKARSTLVYEKDYQDICAEWLGGLKPEKYASRVSNNLVGISMGSKR